MAEIWLGRQSGLQGFEKLVVIKRIAPGLESDPSYVEMFLTEARLAAQLSHANVVQVYELNEQEGSPYIVMEYVDGENLSVVRRTGQRHGLPLADHFSAKLISMAAEGLHYAHTRMGIDGKLLGIVHRDISPQNLIATFDGGLKVLDFGIAKSVGEKTHPGRFSGKLTYMSPEQIRRESLDARSDIFSLGVVFFELVTRTRLLPRMSDSELIARVGGGEPLPSPSERRSDLSAGLETIILKALCPKREQRFQTARELQEALDAWLRQSGRVASAGALADYLRKVFARRFRERQELIETALSKDLTPTSTNRLRELIARQRAAGTSSAGTHSTTVGVARRRAPLVALVLLSLLVVGMGVAIARRMERASSQLLLAAAETSANQAKAAQIPKSGPLPSPLVPSQAELPAEHNSDAGLELPPATGPAEPSSDVRPDQEPPLKSAEAPPEEPEIQTPPEKQKGERRNKSRVQKARQEPMGKLTLKTTPWTTVYLGKKKLGDTPLVAVPLPAGRHMLRLVRGGTDEETAIEVEIRSNETVVKKLRL